MKAIIWLALGCAVAFGQMKTQEPIQTTLCEIIKQPERFNGKLVEFRAQIESGVMYLPSGVSNESCAADVPFFSIDDRHLAALVKDKEFKKLTKYLTKTSLVQATVTGWFEHKSGEKGGSGLILESVDKVTMQPQKRKGAR
jgi:hypothetical protein